MRKIISLIAFVFPFLAIAQNGSISGTITEAISGQPVPGAQVKLSNGLYGVSNDYGKYEITSVPYGEITVTVLAYDLDTLTKIINLNKPGIILDLKMGEATELEEVKITGSISIDRVTPVAITRITAAQIAEELGSRDLPMILNGTPGVYATQTGGGDGDARITVRGFDQRNVGVLIDGVPVNDMENGAVYWSNWFGLDAITNQIQVQRGLGATKLSMPSVGGSLNIITTGANARKGFSFKQETATGQFYRTSLTYNSGMLKNGWGFLASGSYKRSEGWVEANYSKGYFYYFKVQKKMEKHLIAFSAFGAPQEHGQRSFNQRIQYWNAETARKLGALVDSSQQMDHGIRFNQHWGYLADGNDSVQKNERINFYHKPQLTLKDLWTVNKKMTVSNIAYMSIGRGGGTRLANSAGTLYTADGHLDWNEMYTANQVNSLFGTPTIDNQYSDTELKSSQVMLTSMNNHMWVGYLGQLQYEYSSKLTFNGGVDYRYYKGTHYQEIYDIMGGDYFINSSNKNQASPMNHEGDKISLNSYSNHRDGLVQWAGVFGSAEYVSSRWSVFLNLSGVMNAYKGRDYFQKKVLHVGDTTLRIGANDTIEYQGQSYNAGSAGLEWYETDWKYIPGATMKMGASYILNESSNVFINAGYLSRTPQFSNVIDNNTNTYFAEITNEIIQAVEIGYSYTGKKFGYNVNGYFTNWKNKPFPFGVSIPDPQDPTSSIYLNINGMDAIHKGAEIDVAYSITEKLSSEFMFSIGDWRWNSSETFYVPDYDYSFTFDAKGVHVGDAAQTMMNWSVRYEPFKRFYVKLQYQWFDRYYANFSPFTLQGANGGRDSWKIPAYGMLNGFIGYTLKLKKCSLFFNGSVTNILNHEYISDATNNFYGTDFDAGSASVMFGPGFRFNTSVGVNF